VSTDAVIRRLRERVDFECRGLKGWKSCSSTQLEDEQPADISQVAGLCGTGAGTQRKRANPSR